MSQLRPRSMSQGAFAALLCEHGFTACSKTAVSLAERPKESGVQFTPEARKAAQGLLKSTRRQENRVNGNKTTVWFDDETRAWLEQRAWLEDMSVGEIIRNLVTEAIETGWRPKGKIYPWEKEEAAGAAATAPTAEELGDH